MYLSPACVFLLQLSSQHHESLLQQRGDPESQALPVGLRVEMLLQAAVEAQRFAIALLLLLVALLDLCPQQSQLPLHLLQTLQVQAGDHHGRKDGLQGGEERRDITGQIGYDIVLLYREQDKDG